MSLVINDMSKRQKYNFAFIPICFLFIFPYYGSPVTMTWRFLRLRLETASRYWG